MSLKEITKDLHTEAEKTKFAKLLLSGEISEKDYACYLYQMSVIYEIIEQACRNYELSKNLNGIDRAIKIRHDLHELAGDKHKLRLLPSTKDYMNYLLELVKDPERRYLIKAHMYCRHMGDLFGGQYIAKKVPGSGRFYQFDNAEELKNKIRAELTDEYGSEARTALEWSIKIMKELGRE